MSKSIQNIPSFQYKKHILFINHDILKRYTYTSIFPLEEKYRYSVESSARRTTWWEISNELTINIYAYQK